MNAVRVAYVVRSWPRLSQTFVLNEALALERLGAELTIFSMVASGESLVQPQVSALRAGVTYLDRMAARPRLRRLRDHLSAFAAAPARYLATLGLAAVRRDLAAGYSTSSSMACFGHAVFLGGRLRATWAGDEPVRHLHAHFAHDPALIALFVHRLTGISYSFTAHARDLYGVPSRALAVKARHARSVLTCCHANAEYLATVLVPPALDRVRVIHHGVDLATFAPPSTLPDNAVPRVVSIGRLVEKKGFAELLSALAGVKAAGGKFACSIFGEGPLLGELESRRDELGLADDVEFGGARRHDELVGELRQADIFALTPLVTADGDRDGVPNVLVEAMACGLSVVTTEVGGISDLVEHGHNALVAESHDVEGVADHLSALLVDPSLRQRLGREARRTVEERFDVAGAAAELMALFGSPAS